MPGISLEDAIVAIGYTASKLFALNTQGLSDRRAELTREKELLLRRLLIKEEQLRNKEERLLIKEEQLREERLIIMRSGGNSLIAVTLSGKPCYDYCYFLY